MLLYVITSRMLLADTELERAEKLVALASLWAAHGVNYIQIRERDLPDAHLLDLASRIVPAVHRTSSHTKVLINSNPETALAIALQSAADGVHLQSGLSPEGLAATVDQIRKGWLPSQAPTISVSCHSPVEIRAARAAGATLALFAPVFEKVLPGAPALEGQGLECLAQACRAACEPSSYPEIAVIALGGVTLENAERCVAAGAAGLAAIRLFLNSGEDQNWQQLAKMARKV